MRYFAKYGICAAALIALISSQAIAHNPKIPALCEDGDELTLERLDVEAENSNDTVIELKYTISAEGGCRLEILDFVPHGYLFVSLPNGLIAQFNILTPDPIIKTVIQKNDGEGRYKIPPKRRSYSVKDWPGPFVTITSEKNELVWLNKDWPTLSLAYSPSDRSDQGYEGYTLGRPLDSPIVSLGAFRRKDSSSWLLARGYIHFASEQTDGPGSY